VNEGSIRPDRSHGDGIVVTRRDGDVAIFSHGSGAMALFDPEDGRFLEVNDAWIARYGWTRDEAHRMHVEDVSTEPKLTEDAVQAALEAGGGHVDLRWHKTKSGEVFPVELTSGTLQVGGRVLMYAVSHDISRRTEAEASLQRSEARFRALSESLPLGILVHRGPRILYANPAARAMMGVPSDADLGEASLFDLIPPEDQATALADMASIEAGTPGGPRERRFVMPGGGTVWAEISAIPVDFDGETAILVMVRDLRDQKRMEAQLMLADRLASLGRLAASVGHEINNPLAYMLGNVQMLQRDLRQNLGISEEDRADLLARLTLVEDGAMRVRDIVHDLKGLSVGDRITVGAIDLHRVLDLCANMAEHEIRNRATLVRDYGPAVSVRASEARLGQVFLNLLVNAAHAVLGEDKAGDNEIRVTTRRASAGTVLIEVRDTGVGIAAEHMERIFEPFFTTKEHAGTGLGLSISHAIVTAMGGTITVEAQHPRGTCFRVTLPCEPEAA
jgi:PAS domain S-box-containing protein